MKIIIRNRNKNIEVVNVASKEEMVWCSAEQFAQMTTECSKAAMDFMQEHPQIHEVKFSTVPELDGEEDEDAFFAGEEAEEKAEEKTEHQED